MTFDELEFNPTEFGIQARVVFKNGYGASIVKSTFSYGGPEGKYELAVMLGEDLCYDTPITDDVIGHLTEDEVSDLLVDIENLPAPEGV